MAKKLKPLKLIIWRFCRMKIIVYKYNYAHTFSPEIKVAEILKETPKTYKIGRIEGLKWRNKAYGSVIHKSADVLYTGELTEKLVALVEAWNAHITEKDNKIAKVKEDYKTILDDLSKRIKAVGT
jgi:hypothetical protein